MKRFYKQIANIVTMIRIAISILIISSIVYSRAFYILYLLAGLTDVVDGFLARRLNIESVLGSKLDTFADIVFTITVMIKVLPTIMLPLWIYIWIGAIALVKIANIIYGYNQKKEFVPVHSILNKTTGVLLFALPLTLSFIDIKYSSIAICIVASIATINERKVVDHYVA